MNIRQNAWWNVSLQLRDTHHFTSATERIPMWPIYESHPKFIHSQKILTHPINCLTLKKIKKRSRVPASFQTVILACDIMGDISRSSRAALQGCLATRQLHVSQLPLFFLCLVQHELNVCMSTEREAGCQTQQRKAHQHMLIMLNKKKQKKNIVPIIQRGSFTK